MSISGVLQTQTSKQQENAVVAKTAAAAAAFKVWKLSKFKLYFCMEFHEISWTRYIKRIFHFKLNCFYLHEDAKKTWLHLIFSFWKK